MQLLGLPLKYMEVDISKAEKKIKLLTERVGCSEEGRLWLEQALDPFTDTPKRPVGFPDLITGRSIVQVVKQSLAFDAASGGDVHVFLDNVDSRHYMYKNNNFIESGITRPNMWNASATGGIASYVRGGCVVRYSTTTGVKTDITTTVTCTPLPSTYTKSSRIRVIAKGFEIHNVTPLLSVGGALTVYRDSTTGGFNPDSCGTVVNESTPQSSLSLPVYPLAKVPETLAEVMLIPGAKQWDAKEGCYCVATMNSQTNIPGDTTPCILTATDSSNGTNDTYLNVAKGTVFPLVQEASMTRSPFFVSGAYLSGLPVGTQLVINTVYIIERFVDQSNQDLVVLSSPSPFYDVVALELYAKSAHILRAGVPVSENDAGDWIKDIADVLGDFGVPGMPLVKGGVDLYNKIAGVDSKHDKKKNDQSKEIELLHQRLNNIEKMLSGSIQRFNVPQISTKTNVMPKNISVIPKKTILPKKALSKPSK